MSDYEELSFHLNYCHKSGVLTWARGIGGRNNNKFKAGSEAGCKTKSGYILVRVNGVLYKAHRVAWLLHYGEWPKGHIDHINHVKSDNRIENIRDVTPAENNKNFPRQKSKSGVTNVYYADWAKKYRVSIFTDGKKRHIGYYKTKDEAVKAAAAARDEFNFHHNHGDYDAK